MKIKIVKISLLNAIFLYLGQYRKKLYHPALITILQKVHFLFLAVKSIITLLRLKNPAAVNRFYTEPKILQNFFYLPAAQFLLNFLFLQENGRLQAA
jgi:hypothetical protein